jgi:hypothetical protein
MAEPVHVRFAEGLTHGYLVLRDVRGEVLAHGSLLQASREGEIDKRMVFHFKDGSLFDEHVTFTQHESFALKSYRLTARGPAFEDDREISMTPGTGAYRVQTKDRATGREKTLEGTLGMPQDVYNGLIITVVKDLPKGASDVVHYIAFTPEPRLIEVEIAPLGEQRVNVGDITESAMYYALKPRLGPFLRFFATILGRVPPDSHIWVATEDVPAFVGFEGSLMTPGPTWRIEAVSPSLPR